MKVVTVVAVKQQTASHKKSSSVQAVEFSGAATDSLSFRTLQTFKSCSFSKSSCFLDPLTEVGMALGVFYLVFLYSTGRSLSLEGKDICG